MPVSLTISNNKSPKDPIIGYRYENPMIGTSNNGNSITNDPPSPSQMQLNVTVSNLKTGENYNLYLYLFTDLPLASSPLNIPSSNFNSNSHLANKTFNFIASSNSHHLTYSILSSYTLVFRCVEASAP